MPPCSSSESLDDFQRSKAQGGNRCIRFLEGATASAGTDERLQGIRQTAAATAAVSWAACHSALQ